MVADTATVTGTESGLSFTASGSTSTTIAPSLPAGFNQTKLAGGLKKPILVSFVPGSSDIWIGTQGGMIYDYRGGALSTTPVVTLPNVVQPGRVPACSGLPSTRTTRPTGTCTSPT